MKKKIGADQIAKTAAARLPTRFGAFKIYVFQCKPSEREHTVLSMGKLSGRPVLVRLHSQCLTGDTFGSLRCDCGAQLQKSLEIIYKAKRGILVYLNQEGRGIGLTNKIRAYALQDKGLDTVQANAALHFPADLRDYKVAAKILKKLGVKKIILITNNPDKEIQLERDGVIISHIVPLEIKPNRINASYLRTKKNKMGHRLTKV